MNVRTRQSAVRWYLVAVATVLAVVISVVHPQSVAAGTITTLSSTIPSNGDVNPYGVFLIPQTMGKLTRGNILISNFNNTKNLQGTGTTLVEISPTGAFTQFAQISRKHLPGPCPGEVGLTTALVVLRSGWVIVGSLPTSDGSSATAKAGCLLVLDSNGKLVETIAGPDINGPWDMTVFDQTTNNGTTGQATLFVTNVLNGTLQAGGNLAHDGTVLRIVVNASTSMMPTVQSMMVIA